MASAQNRDDKMIKTVFLLLSIYCMAFSQSHIRGIAKIYNIENPDPEAETSQYIYQPESLALFARMEVQPSDERKQLINNLIIDLKAAGLWSGFDAFWMFAAHDDQAALLNWVENDHNCTSANSPAFEANRGYTGNGSSSYLNTDFIPSTDGVNYLLNDGSFGVYIRNAVDADVVDMGGRGATSTHYLYIKTYFVGALFLAINGGTNFSFEDPVSSAGFTVVSRNASNSFTIYKNGDLHDTISGNSVDRPPVAIYILAQNMNGTAQSFSTRQVAFAFIAGALSANEQEPLFNLVEAYLDAIGAGVVE